VAGGVELRIADRGIGLDPVQLSALNTRLGQPALTEVVGAQHLGTYVVARLAARLNASVYLEPGLTSGTVAVVVLSGSVFVSDAGRAGTGQLGPADAGSEPSERGERAPLLDLRDSAPPDDEVADTDVIPDVTGAPAATAQRAIPSASPVPEQPVTSSPVTSVPMRPSLRSLLTGTPPAVAAGSPAPVTAEPAPTPEPRSEPRSEPEPTAHDVAPLSGGQPGASTLADEERPTQEIPRVLVRDPQPSPTSADPVLEPAVGRPSAHPVPGLRQWTRQTRVADSGQVPFDDLLGGPGSGARSGSGAPSGSGHNPTQAWPAAPESQPGPEPQAAPMVPATQESPDAEAQPASGSSPVQPSLIGMVDVLPRKTHGGLLGRRPKVRPPMPPRPPILGRSSAPASSAMGSAGPAAPAPSPIPAKNRMGGPHDDPARVLSSGEVEDRAWFARLAEGSRDSRIPTPSSPAGEASTDLPSPASPSEPAFWLTKQPQPQPANALPVPVPSPRDETDPSSIVTPQQGRTNPSAALLELSHFGGYQPDVVAGESAVSLPRRLAASGPVVPAQPQPSGAGQARRDPGQASALFSAFRSGVQRAKGDADVEG